MFDFTLCWLLCCPRPNCSTQNTCPSQLCGKRIATSFPKITADYFAKLDPTKTTAVRELSGSVEAACGLGLADAVVDLVETGTTMRAAGLEEVQVIMKTQACLVSNKLSKHQKIIGLLKTRVEGYLTATRYQMISYNIERSKLPEASKVIAFYLAHFLPSCTSRRTIHHNHQPNYLSSCLSFYMIYWGFDGNFGWYGDWYVGWCGMIVVNSAAVTL